MNESTARNIRVQDRYDELMRIGSEVKEEKARGAAAALLTVQHDYQEIKSLKFQLVEREKEIGRLMNILEMIEHATAPSHDDGAFHENAYSLARSAKEQLG